MPKFSDFLLRYNPIGLFSEHVLGQRVPTQWTDALPFKKGGKVTGKAKPKPKTKTKPKKK